MHPQTPVADVHAPLSPWPVCEGALRDRDINMFDPWVRAKAVDAYVCEASHTHMVNGHSCSTSAELCLVRCAKSRAAVGFMHTSSTKGSYRPSGA